MFDRLGEQLTSVHQRASDLSNRVNEIFFRTAQLNDPDGATYLCETMMFITNYDASLFCLFTLVNLQFLYGMCNVILFKCVREMI